MALWDLHIHTTMSFDGRDHIDAMCESAIKKGLWRSPSKPEFYSKEVTILIKPLIAITPYTDFLIV